MEEQIDNIIIENFENNENNQNTIDDNTMTGEKSEISDIDRTVMQCNSKHGL